MSRLALPSPLKQAVSTQIEFNKLPPVSKGLRDSI